MEHTVDVAGIKRSYLLYVPEKIKINTPVPVVLVFHGGGGRPDNMPRITGFTDRAEAEGFVVVYPRGTSRLDFIPMYTWNGGLCCGFSQQEAVDDVGFIRALLDDLESVVSVDPRRIYATGLSNGAILSYRLACELADRIAAVGPVAGTQNIAECHPSRPVSVIHFHGTADPNEPYEGGRGSGPSGVSFAPVKDTIGFWVQADGCPETAVREETGPVLREIYGPCRGGSAVELNTIAGGGHSWPGGERWAPYAEEPTRAVDATALMWAFFQAHPKP
ncbi:MAG: hypothetical protein A3K46_05745 [Chloroflexi bacterium RBG_13_60_9]|nr:MAG: hypothetical protein A3K46_05745 [Chloroflexi bacterium RBG_13_60_9]